MALVASSFVVDRLIALFPARDTRAYIFVFPRFSKRVSVTPLVAEKLVHFLNAAE